MQRIVILICAALLFVPVILKSRRDQAMPAPTAFRVLSSGMASVKVSGDVKHPGIYEVPANSLAISVIKMAIPERPMKQPLIDPSAHPLPDGSAVTLAMEPDGTFLLTTGQMTVPERLVLKIPLDISTMSEADFELLPGVGPALAKRIIEYRQKNGGILRVGDLQNVAGIGNIKYRTILDCFQVP